MRLLLPTLMLAMLLVLLLLLCGTCWTSADVGTCIGT